MKLLTVTVPCYNSAAYMQRCVDSLLPGGEEMDILIIDDGSTDETGAIADRYVQNHPGTVRVIHQENGGHGEGINQGLKNALGTYFKVVDSDDRLDPAALVRLLDVLRRFAARGEEADLIVNNYVYDQAERQAVFSVNYRVAIKPGRMLSWEDIRRFPVHKQFMIHSLIYRTGMLRDMGLVLPKHTFYEDNLYIYQPLPYTKRVYYFDEPLYGYFIGRPDQSIAEKNILKRLDQVSNIAEKMITSYTLAQLKALPKSLYGYMINNCAGMLATTSALQFIAETEESLAMNRHMWQAIREFDEALYQKLRSNLLGLATVLPGAVGRRTLVSGYRFVRRIIQF
ncbi:MAG: glycosyltransferase family 2 protein [Clostridiales bacterium]|nr:glycosyltransferase family 2 protein [Clostridiales bacterium]